MKSDIEVLTEDQAKKLKLGTPLFVTVEKDMIAGIGLFLKYNEKEKRVYVVDGMFKDLDKTDGKWIPDDLYYDLDYCYTFNAEAVVESKLLEVLKRK